MKTWKCNFDRDSFSSNTSAGYLEIGIFKCPGCGKEAISARGINGYMDDSTVSIYPAYSFKKFPDYIPKAIRSDYEEACAIVDRSPKATATLARRCLQRMIRDFWGINGKNLNDEISKVAEKVPASQWKAIDALRKIGNIGAHMEKDVNLIVDVDPCEASKLIQLIEYLMEKWYIDRHDAEELYSNIVATSEEKAEARKG